LLSGQRGVEAEAHAFLGLDREPQPITLELRAGRQGKHEMRRAMELNHDVAVAILEPFARAQEKRHATPAPVVDVQPNGGKSRRPRASRDAGLLVIAVV